MRPTGVFVKHFNELVTMLQSEQVDFEAMRGIVAGEDGVLLKDPAGNWVAVTAWREFW